MASPVQLTSNTVVKLVIRRGTDQQRQQVTLASGELGFTTDTERVFVGNGNTGGGVIVGNKTYISKKGVEDFSNPYYGDLAYVTYDATGKLTNTLYIRNTTNSINTLNGWTSVNPVLGAPFDYSTGTLLFNSQYLNLNTASKLFTVQDNITTITLSANDVVAYNLPTVDVHATNKLYVDTLVNATSNADQLYTRVYIGNNFVPLSGKATITGALSTTSFVRIPTAPIHAYDAPNKLYVDTLTNNTSDDIYKYVYSNYLPLTGERQITGYIDTDIASAVPALRLKQSGLGAALRIEDVVRNTTPFIVDNYGSLGIGITPPAGSDTKITVKGSMSASGNLIILGNTGVGTPSPVSKLDVRGDVNIGDPNINTTKTAGNKLLFNSTNNSDILALYRYNTSADVSELRTQIGNNIEGDASDAFVVGNIPDITSQWMDWLRVKYDKMTYRGDLTVAGLGEFSGNTQIGNGAAQGIYNDGNNNIAIRNNEGADGGIKFQTYNGVRTDMHISSVDGHVGIGVSPSATAKLAVAGKIYASDAITSSSDIIAFSSSDERLKNNIQPIPSALDKIDLINGVEYDWNTELQSTYTGHDVGVLAQEVENILPEAVTTREDGYKAVRYEKVIPLLIQAIKELKTEVRALKNI